MKVKLVISLILAVLFFVFGYQNTEVVQVDFLVWSVDISLALLVFITLGAGLALGWMLSSYLRFSRNRKRLKAVDSPQTENAVTDKVSTPSIAGDKKTDEQEG